MVNSGNLTADQYNHIKMFIQTYLKMYLCRIPGPITAQYMPIYDSLYIKWSGTNLSLI
jgi:hypothetical protein